MANLKEQIAQLQREIKQWQLDPGGSAAMKRQLQALQSELDNLVKRERAPSGDRRRPRLAVVKPTPPPQVELTPNERAVWSSFFNFHRALLQYSGWVNRDQWLQMADVAADMTGGNPMLSEEFPSGPGIWVWDGTSRLWVRTHGIPFPTHDKVWGWDGDNQRWVKIEGGDGEMGVTDGSDAAPGRVGEFVSVTNIPSPSVPFTVNTVGQLGSITLSPGDWMVGAQVDAWLNTVATDPVTAFFGLAVGTLTQADFTATAISGTRAFMNQMFPPGGDQVCGSFGPIRVNVTSPTQVGLAIFWFSVSALPGQADYSIWARRMR